MMNRNSNGHVNVSETETLETCPKTLLGHFCNIQRVRKRVSGPSLRKKQKQCLVVRLLEVGEELSVKGFSSIYTINRVFACFPYVTVS